MLIRTDGKLHARCDMVLVENLEGSLADVTIEKDLDNGSVGVLGDYSAVEREVREFTAPTGSETKGELYILCSPELIYDESRKALGGLKHYYNVGTASINGNPEAYRAYPMSKVKKFKLSEEGIDASDVSDKLEVGQYVKVEAGSYTLKATTSKAGAVGKIVRIDQEGIKNVYDKNNDFLGLSYNMYVIQVL